MVGQVDEVVEDLDFGGPLLELPGVPLLQGKVAGVLHQTRIPRLEKLNIQVTAGKRTNLPTRLTPLVGKDDLDA